MSRGRLRRGVLALAVLIVGSTAGSGISVAEAGLDRFYRQELRWGPCGEAKLDAAKARCADIAVPLNYAEPQGRAITVAISRVSAGDPARRRGVLLGNPGGPGSSGLGFTAQLGDHLDIRDGYDLIGFDPRGVGRSTPLHCGWPVSSDLRSAGVDSVGFGATLALEAELAARCLARNGATQSFITTRNTARDMDVIRAVLGAERISYIGASYGTYLGAVFTQMFPERVDRFVLDSAVDPARYHVAMIQDEGAPNEAAFDVWADWVAARDGEYHLGTTGPAVRATVTGLIERAARRPIRIGEYEVDAHLLPMILFEGIREAKAYPELAASVRQLAQAEYQPVRPEGNLAEYLEQALRPKEDEAAEAIILCGDAEAPRDPAWYWRNIEASRASQPIFGAFANGPNACAFWQPPIEPPTVVGNAVPALILQAVQDTRTAYQQGVGLHRALTGSRLVTMPDRVAHGVMKQSSCASHAAEVYLGTGVLPAEDITCPADRG
ncbi:alpha/beta fold hydrolase [Nocardia panacis]|uniref:Alpha/beta fold hydrolase n=1 Tax=Nocardia panacis TaxID=2340916 RepID=A0A3A4JU86_9NOCA|nr:alpha/beta fold hydrolase [Nocardia panacis]RJO73616.1 alpha/beta fold hydrolase [Nocardia panacis]